jgi:large subunit ribosomal protein L1
MAKITKRQKAWADQFDRQTKYPVEQAIELAKKFAIAKFGERLDIAIRLGVDPRKSDQMIRSSLVLPAGTGQTLRVLVFAKGDKEKEALEAGADYAGADELAEKIQGGWFEFDRVVATPDMMGLVGKIGKLLGPKGLMPNPKTGTVTADVKTAVSEIKKGQVQFRTEKGAIIHCTIGLANFETSALQENIQALYDALVRLKPSAAKGTYIKAMSISTTMGPGIKIDENQYR